MKKLLLLLALLFAPLSASGQVGNMFLRPFAGVPSGACAEPLGFALNTTNGDFYSCDAGAWVKIGPGAAATGYQTIEEEGTPLTQRTTLNMIGGTATCVDNVTKTDCTFTAGGGTHDILSATHTDTTAAVVSRGSIVVGKLATPKWEELVLGGVNLYLKSNGTDLIYSTLAASGVGSCGANQFETADNADAAPTCTTAVLASAQFANQGTNIQVLHGNAAGNPSWGQVLPADIGDGGVAATFAFFSGAAGDPSFRAIADGDLPSGLTRDTESPNAAGDISGTYSAGLTIDAGSVASAELATANKTFAKSIVVINPTTTEDDKVQWMHSKAVTYTSVNCSTNVGTATIDMDHRVLTTPNTVGTDILTGTIVCDTDNQADGGFADATIPADVPVNLSITAVASTPGTVRIHITYTVD